MLSLLLVAIFQSSHAGVMFGLKKEYLFSEVEGQLLNNGVPVSNITIRQMCSGDDQVDITFETQTDAEGRFRFAEVTQPSRFHGPFDPFSVPQLLTAIIDNKEEDLWVNAKRSTKQNSEADGKALRLVCDLAKPLEKDKDTMLTRITRCEFVDTNLEN